MSITFSFAPRQNQTFELRCEHGTRQLPQPDLIGLIEQCESTYYSGRQRDSRGRLVDNPADLVNFGRTLYGWLDGPEGWLRSQMNEGDDLTIYLELDMAADMAALNADTQRVALGLAHLPWELLHDGDGFVMTRANLDVLPVRQVVKRSGAVANVQNRPLRLLFMATAPEGATGLQYEQEEANILQATKAQNQTLDLVVEESGSLQELKSLVQSYTVNHFDVFHLTGHGFVKDKQPCFVTEDAYGEPVYSTAKDLARTFKNRWPRVVFLSGCHTGQVLEGGAVPSMAAALISAGASVVLGWARPVYDQTAIVAAEALYQSLATGASVEEAVRAAQQVMIQQNLEDDRLCTDWHLLRMYRDSRAVDELVTPLRTKGREKIRRVPADKEFLDEKGEVKVVGRAGFVGRRRPLQRCLRAMRETSEQVGVYIHGMGGLGKSTLAARICSRMKGQRPAFEQVVIVGPLDEQTLRSALARKYEQHAEIVKLLNQSQANLRGQLRSFFEAIEAEIDKPLLLVLDDFEQNIPRKHIEDGSLTLTRTGYGLLDAICEALVGGESRLIVTCRYYEATALPPGSQGLHVEALAQMSKEDVAKKRGRLADELSSAGKETTEEITLAAAGNPRLLEWLAAAVAQGLQADELAAELEATEEKFRENVLAQALVGSLEPETRESLARLSVVQLPVEKALVPDDVWAGTAEQTLAKLTGLGLVEQSRKGATAEAAYRVSRILEPLLSPILDESEWQGARQVAVQWLYQVWWKESEKTDARALEIVRLALLADEREIAAVVGNAIASNWYNSARFVEALELCQQILEQFEDYRILGAIAKCESTLGFVTQAMLHYERANNICPAEDLKEKAATLSNMASVIAQQGDIERALTLWNDSL
ncbi:MAG: CHAT domain-containing protein, partial [Cyanobacteria bacterium J06643_4]